jgi:hypothetical protein
MSNASGWDNYKGENFNIATNTKVSEIYMWYFMALADKQLKKARSHGAN